MKSSLVKNGFLLIGTLLVWGCTTEYNLATKQEEFILYGTDKEIQIGEKVAAQIENQFEVVKDVDQNERVEKILERIVAVCDRKDLVYFIKILDKDITNAVSLPGGYLYIFSGLLERVENDDQLASVIAHEIAHITAKHGVKRVQSAYGALIIQLASTQAGGNVAGGVNFALISLFMEHSQEAEYEADSLGVTYLKRAGYDTQQMLRFLEILKKEQEKEPIRPYSYWKTHPNIAKRMAVVNQEISGKLEFKDYLNLIGD